jgi:hypothetical protein
MKTIIDYFKKQDNLVALSGWITSGIMCLLFILMQILAFSNIIKEPEKEEKKMELRELVKLRFEPQIEKEIPEKIKFQPQKIQITRSNKPENQNQERQAKPSINVASLAQGFDMSKLVSRETNAAKKGGSNLSNPLVAGVSTDVNRQGRTLDDFDLTGVLENRSSSFSAGRRSARGGANSTRVGIGGNSSIGNGSGTGGTGLALSGRGTSRASRGGGIGNGNGGASISLPSGSGGGSASLDINALIKWMKAHPGPIPKLVAYDMGHQGDDLSSAVNFTSDGKNYTLFLSCNEVELLLRICLVENNDFTLLKDNGIQEESNYLTVGDVVRDANKIQSLISSRKAPGDRAAIFYKIFWSWWLRQPESRS